LDTRLTKALTALSAILLWAAAAPAHAQESSLSKSITAGWKSVVKETSKAARTVSKAANDAITPDKPKRRKTAKRKTDVEPKESQNGDAKEAANEQSAVPAAKPAVKSGKQARPSADDTDDGPPVPLAAARDAEAPPAPPKPALKTQAMPGKRLPPPPPHENAKPADESGWAASKQETTAAPRLPVAESVPVDGESDGPHPNDKPLPVTMIPPKPPGGPTVEANAWSKAEIDAAKASCATILKSVDAVTIPEAPVREGNCGTPAPVRLISIGKNPEVALSPPPLVTCDLVAGLHVWMRDHIQPLSKRQFGSPVIKIETMSDYSCRMAYGRKGNKLSEHGRANALDIRGFVTAKGEAAYVLEQWGKTARDRAAEAAALAAQKAAAENAARAAAAAGSKSAIEAETADAKLDVALPANARQPALHASLGAAQKTAKQTEIEKAAAAIVPDAPRSKKALFLHDAHTAACKIFGTSLGPESNEAHRNHFHVDMAERKRTKICE
jgi:hypothetical protein